MATQFKYLDKGLSSNCSLGALVNANHNSTYLGMLDQLFRDLYNSKCSGIDIKINEVHDLLRFEGLVSELQFAKYFSVVKQWQVELLAHNAFGERRVPDMIAVSGKRKYYVEVKNIQFDSAEHGFGTKIAELLNNKGRRFVVVLKSLSKLATPAYWYQSKSEKKKQVQEALSEFETKLAKIQSSTETGVISTSIADIELLPTEREKSFLGITTTEVITEPKDYGPRIVYDVIDKSSKRDDWTDMELDIPYLIAIDDSSWMFDDACRYNIELFGSSTEFYPPLPVPNPTIDGNIQNALDLGWKDYLFTMHILRNGRSVIQDEARGKFFTEPKLKNATAILVKHRDTFYLLANPFADNRINKPDILKELADCIIGW